MLQEDGITADKHKQIVAWTEHVNRSMDKPAVADSPAGARKPHKIRYLKYSPPGSPAREEGFRRVPAVPPGNGTKKVGDFLCTDPLPTSTAPPSPPPPYRGGGGVRFHQVPAAILPGSGMKKVAFCVLTPTTPPLPALIHIRLV